MVFLLARNSVTHSIGGRTQQIAYDGIAVTDLAAVALAADW
jgi:hypothetical protein